MTCRTMSTSAKQSRTHCTTYSATTHHKMPSFNAYKRMVERAIDDSSDLGSRVSAEVDAAVMAATPREAGRHAKKAVRILQQNGRYAARADVALDGMVAKHQEVVDENYDLTQENGSLKQKVSTWIKRAVVGAIMSGTLFYGLGFGTGHFSKRPQTAPESAPASTTETAKPALPAEKTVAVENNDLYFIEKRE